MRLVRGAKISLATHFIILEGGIATHQEEISFGGNQISDEISNELQLSFQEAEALKISSLKEKSVPEATQSVIEKTGHSLCAQVQEALTRFITQAPKASLDKK